MKEAPPSPDGLGGPAAQNIPDLIAFARIGSDSQKTKAVRVLRQLLEDESNMELIVSGGGIPVLIELARGGASEQKDHAVCMLANLSTTSVNRERIGSAAGVPALVELLRGGDEFQQSVAIGTLLNLSVHPNNKELIATAGGIPLLVALVRYGDEEQKDEAAIVLGNLAYRHPSIAEQIVRNGGMEALVSLLTSGNDAQKCSAAGALCFLNPSERTKSLIAESGGVDALRKFVAAADREGAKLMGLAALQILGCENEDSTADGATTLSGVVQSGMEQLGRLASAIFSTMSRETKADWQHEKCRSKFE